MVSYCMDIHGSKKSTSDRKTECWLDGGYGGIDIDKTILF